MKEGHKSCALQMEFRSKVQSYLLRCKKVGGKHISTKYCKYNRFQVTIDLINSDNLQLAFAQLCTELQVCNYTML